MSVFSVIVGALIFAVGCMFGAALASSVKKGD